MNLYTQIPKRLSDMVMAKQAEVEAISEHVSKTLLEKPTLAKQFLSDLHTERPSYILEFKPASPSKGDINPTADISEVVSNYQPFATAISVLVDKQFFKGGYDYLRRARQLTDKPLLCKDIVFDSRQIIEGKRCGADIILLMLSVLSDQLYQELFECAKSLGMAVISEVSNADECLRLQHLPAECVGINHRDFADLSIDLDKTHKLINLISTDLPVIAESGIYYFDDFQRIHPRANNFLIGSSLMEAKNLASSLRRLLFGDIKVCGITSADQAKALHQIGASYIGLICYSKSPRNIERLESFKEVSADIPLVGVFVNHNLESIIAATKIVNFAAIQLHGDEDLDYICRLRKQLHQDIAIWKAVHDLADDDNLAGAPIDQILLDGGTTSQRGGTGMLADWSSVPNDCKPNIRLAGGISIDNIALALSQGFRQFDLNSKIESKPGIKDMNKFKQCIQNVIDFRSNKE
jgi:indole-3-glycerol phosphate synthase / phosphoribosylanthranilate isomerase